MIGNHLCYEDEALEIDVLVWRSMVVCNNHFLDILGGLKRKPSDFHISNF